MQSWFENLRRFKDPKSARRVAHFIAALSRFPQGRLVDLGAGHGMFSQIAVDMGWTVTAVDARDERFPDDDRIEWITADIREFTIDHDVVACLGLWYHLTLQDQLDLAARSAPRPLIIDTHVALLDAARHPAYHGLSELVDYGNYQGRLYSEEGLQATPTASWGNESSFWPTEATLDLQLREGRYDVVEHVSPWIEVDRRYVVARCLDSTEFERSVTRYCPLG